jgi:hypothetical protein
LVHEEDTFWSIFSSKKFAENLFRSGSGSGSGQKSSGSATLVNSLENVSISLIIKENVCAKLGM